MMSLLKFEADFANNDQLLTSF